MDDHRREDVVNEAPPREFRRERLVPPVPSVARIRWRDGRATLVDGWAVEKHRSAVLVEVVHGGTTWQLWLRRRDVRYRPGVE